VVFNSETTDTLNEYDPTTGTFTPAASGTYLVEVAVCLNSVPTGRSIISIWTGTASEFRRVNDSGGGAVPQGAVLVDLTAGTGYTIRYIPAGTSPNIAFNGGYTRLRIRRLF
jgi:hypothetical protein